MASPKRVWRRKVSTGQNLGEITFNGWQKDMSLQRCLRRNRGVVGKPKYVICSEHKKGMFQVGGSCPLGQMLFVNNKI